MLTNAFLTNKTLLFSVFLSSLLLFNCSSENDPVADTPPEEDIIEMPVPPLPPSFYLGADLSYVNEMEDCGATYKNTEGIEQDPHEIFAEAGCNLVRVRLWHTPDWTGYSTFEDVLKTIRRAKANNMRVLLDFHYSDDWADPNKQEIPAAWLPHIDGTNVLGDSLYNYTHQTLQMLATENLLPEMVQIGNEINPMILQQGELQWPIDWERNSFLLNKGIEAVHDISFESGKEIEVMLHIAQPENGLWWFEQATENGVNDFDWIGLSYYPKWSEYDLENVGEVFSELINSYDKKLMVVETAYPFTMENVDEANNILGNDALIAGYPATQEGQLHYLQDLHEVIKTAGGEGLVYWEPAWVSSNCATRWGNGSHWDNATFFDAEGMPTLGLQMFGWENEE